MVNLIDVNSTNLRNIYPTAPGTTVSVAGTGSRNVSNASLQQADVSDEAANPVNFAAAVGAQGSAVIAGIVLFALLFGLMFLAKRLGTDDDFKSIKPTVYNVVTISLAAAIGLPVWKYLAVRFPVKGVSTWILAA